MGQSVRTGLVAIQVSEIKTNMQIYTYMIIWMENEEEMDRRVA